MNYNTDPATISSPASLCDGDERTERSSSTPTSASATPGRCSANTSHSGGMRSAGASVHGERAVRVRMQEVAAVKQDDDVAHAWNPVDELEARARTLHCPHLRAASAHDGKPTPVRDACEPARDNRTLRCSATIAALVMRCSLLAQLRGQARGRKEFRVRGDVAGTGRGRGGCERV
jgi:hypothetical protein